MSQLRNNLSPKIGRGCKGLQRSKVDVVFQRGMASAFAKASPFAKGFGGHVRAVPIFLLVIRAN